VSAGYVSSAELAKQGPTRAATRRWPLP
jgi:hypothetical protein